MTKLTLVIYSSDGEGGIAIREYEIAERYHAARDERRHVKEHEEIRRRLGCPDTSCHCLFEVVEYGQSPLASIIDYEGNCPTDCSHVRCMSDRESNEADAELQRWELSLQRDGHDRRKAEPRATGREMSRHRPRSHGLWLGNEVPDGPGD